MKQQIVTHGPCLPRHSPRKINENSQRKFTELAIEFSFSVNLTLTRRINDVEAKMFAPKEMSMKCSKYAEQYL